MSVQIDQDHTEYQEVHPLNAVAGGKRPDPPSAMASTMAFAHRALLRIKHVPEQMFDVTVFPIIFLLMFTYLFGGAIAGSTGEYL